MAAFFEEQCGVSRLLEAIVTTAEMDEHICEGKALSDREEAVLQALELLTRGRNQLMWMKANDLRERVARLLGQTANRMRDGQYKEAKNRSHPIHPSLLN